MRTLVKEPIPGVLQRNAIEWREAYVSAKTSDQKKSAERWRHSEIKESLSVETSKKCAYCEARVDSVSWRHVEHILPKGVKPELAHEWSNLTSACSRCNIAKDDYYDSELSLLNPYTDSIDDHLQSFGPWLQPTLGSTTGRISVMQLDLNREDLLMARSQRCESMLALLMEWSAAEPAAKKVLAKGILRDYDEGEYSLVIRALLEQNNFPLGAT